MLSIQSSAFVSHPILSIADFTEDHFYELKQQSGFIAFEGRHYTVTWNSDKTKIESVTRDADDKYWYTGIADFFSRGCNFNYRAIQIQNRLTQLATDVAAKDAALAKANSALARIDNINQCITDIDPTLHSLAPFAHFSSDSESDQDEPVVEANWNVTLSTIGINHQEAIEELKKPLLKELEKLKRNLSSELGRLAGGTVSVNFDQNMVVYERTLAEISKQCIVIANINALHKSTLQSFFSAIKLTKRADLVNVFLGRLVSFSAALIQHAKILSSKNCPADAPKKYDVLLKEQNQLTTLIASQHFDELLLPPSCFNEKEDEIKVRAEKYHSHTLPLLTLLGDHRATMKQINNEVKVLSKIQSNLQQFINAGNVISEYLMSQRKSCYYPEKQVQLLIDLKNECKNPAIDPSDDRLNAAVTESENRIKAMKTGGDIFVFLSKLKGECGKGLISGNFYDAERQMRINSLLVLEKICSGMDVKPDGNNMDTLLNITLNSGSVHIGMLATVAYAHIENIQNWIDTTSLPMGGLAASYECESEKTYEVQQHGRLQKTGSEIETDLRETMRFMQDTHKKMEERGKLLSKVSQGTDNLVDHSEKFKMASKKLRKEFVLLES